MKILDHEQGTVEWMAARCGIPTASNFDMIITGKGESSKQRSKYLFRLAGESVSGSQEETYQNATMQRGIETEAEARSYYELTNDVVVQKVGLCLSDCGKYGASPDGLIGDKGGLEIKCPLMATHVGYILDGTLPSEYFQQVQGNLFVTGREWWDFVSYYNSLKPFVIRVYRDEIFIKKLSVALIEFCEELKSVIRRIK